MDALQPHRPEVAPVRAEVGRVAQEEPLALAQRPRAPANRHPLARRAGDALAIPAGPSIGVAGGFGLAWDVYLAYPRGAVDLTRPAFWMHQLAVTHAPRLEGEAFRQSVSALL